VREQSPKAQVAFIITVILYRRDSLVQGERESCIAFFGKNVEHAYSSGEILSLKIPPE
jgi:hypothetical protein